MRYLLDTDTCIGVLRGREPVLSRVRAHSPAELVLAAMTLAELRFGALNSQDSARAFLILDAFLSAPFAILPFDEPAATFYAEIRHAVRSQPVGTADLIIASTARAENLTVVTNNEREFARIPGLAWENWSKP